MAYALVGTIGSPVTGSAGGTSSPGWGTSESRTAGNLLILWVASGGSATLPSAPSGWSIANQKAGTTVSSSIFYKVAAGADSAPVVAAITSATLTARLAEFSGNSTVSPLDQENGATTTSSASWSVTLPSADATAGELVIGCLSTIYTATPGTKTGTQSFNNGATITSEVNNSGTVIDYYDMGYGITTGNSGADVDSITISTTRLTSSAASFASFKLPAAAVTSTPLMLMGVG